jgi:zinc transport system substrate-binding protein
MAETIVKSSTSKDQKILTLDSLQSVTSKEVESGTTYLGVMESNLSVLKEALK